jgi:hypothetical protein
MTEQGHQEIQLFLRPFPILHAQAVERQLLDAEPTTLFNGGPDAFHAPAVSFDPWQTALLRPAAVAIHDDRYMARQSCWVKTRCGKPFKRITA